MPQTNDKIMRFLVKGNTANVVLATPLDNILDDALDAKSLSDHLKADKPLTLTPSASGTYLVLSIEDKALCYVAEYEKTTYADFMANKGKLIAIKDDNLIAPVSTYFEEHYVKLYAYVDKDIYIYQLNINNEWSRTKLDNLSVVKAQPHLTTFEEIKNADYAYLVGTENWIYSLSEKTDEKIAFVNIDNDMRHIWSVTAGNVWTLTNESLCDNKMDKNPDTVNVGNKLVVTSSDIYLNTTGDLVLNSGTLNGNIDQNVLKNLTKDLPEGNPLALFANKNATSFTYSKDLDISLMLNFFKGWTTSDGSIKDALSNAASGCIKVKFGQPTYAEIKEAYDNRTALVGYSDGYLYPIGKSLYATDVFYYFGLQNRNGSIACVVYEVTKSGWRTALDFLLNNVYNSTTDVKLHQKAYNEYDVTLVTETLEVEEQ